MNFKRNFIWLLPLLVIISGPLWWSGAGKLLKPRGNFSNPVPPPVDQLKSFVLQEVLLTHSQAGRDEFTLKAAKVHSGIHDDVMELDMIEARLLGADGRVTLITGGEALYHTGQQIITVIDNVRVQTADGQEIITEALRYLSKYRKIKTAENVLITGAQGRVVGGNLFYDLVDGDFRVGDNVKVDLY